MKTTLDSITLTIRDIGSDGIQEAIIAACESSDYLASGTVGPSFACSGPGSGWQRNFGASDYAERALSDEVGAAGYVDASDGRLATLDDEGDVVWTDDSVVYLIAPTAEETDDDPETAQAMVDAIDSEHCVEGDGDWRLVRALLRVSEDDALSRWDMEIIAESVIYYDDGTSKWYRNNRSDLVDLRELMGSDDDEIADSAYSHWCAGCHHEGEYETREEAVTAAEGAK